MLKVFVTSLLLIPWWLLLIVILLQTVKRLSAMQEIQVRSLGWEGPLEKEMAAHSSTVAWKIPWAKEPGRLRSMGLQRLGPDRGTSLALSLYRSKMKYSCQTETGRAVWKEDDTDFQII